MCTFCMLTVVVVAVFVFILLLLLLFCLFCFVVVFFLFLSFLLLLWNFVKIIIGEQPLAHDLGSVRPTSLDLCTP